MIKIYHSTHAMLQKELDKCGNVYFDLPEGCYIIDKPLFLHDNTCLRVAPNVIIKIADKARCSALQNDGILTGKTNRNITVEGGVWDGNCDNQFEEDAVFLARNRLDHPSTPEGYNGKHIRFVHVENLILRDMQIKDALSYGIQIADAKFFTVENIRFNYNCRYGTSDGVHVNGPAQFGLIKNLYGLTNDDIVSLTPNDECHGEITKGSISHIAIENIFGDNAYTAVRLLSSGYPLENVDVRNIFGTFRHHALTFTHSRLGGEKRIDNVSADGIFASKSPEGLPEGCFTYWDRNFPAAPWIWFEKDMHVGRVSIKNVHRLDHSNSTGITLFIDEGVTIDRLYLEDISQRFDKSEEAPLFVNKGTIKEFIDKTSTDHIVP